MQRPHVDFTCQDEERIQPRAPLHLATTTHVAQGSVGPFIVNLVAATRTTAKTKAPVGSGAVTANHALLIVEPSSAIVQVPGCTSKPWRSGSAVAIELGSLLFDMPRHVVIATTDAKAGLSFTLEVSGHELAHWSAIAQADAQDAAFTAQIERTAVICALQNVHGGAAASRVHDAHASEMVTHVATALSAGPLKETMTTEGVLAVEPSKFRTWGRHYTATLPFMLRLERRSNFRDLCLQGYNKDVDGEEVIGNRPSDLWLTAAAAAAAAVAAAVRDQ